MSVIDPIGDLLTRIRNAQQRGKENLYVPHSKLKEAVLSSLKERNFIADFREIKEDKFPMLEVNLRPGAIEDLERVSRPGRRIYAAAADIPFIKNGRGMVVLSTSKGIMTGDEARRKGVGGELLLKIW